MKSVNWVDMLFYAHVKLLFKTLFFFTLGGFAASHTFYFQLVQCVFIVVSRQEMRFGDLHRTLEK